MNDHREHLVTSLKLIGYWPKAGKSRPHFSRAFMVREISKGLRELDDDELLVTMWIVNALRLKEPVEKQRNRSGTGQRRV